MSKGWELAYIDNDSCDECGSPAAVNVYRKLVGIRLYRFYAVCGHCLNDWLKRRNQFIEED